MERKQEEPSAWLILLQALRDAKPEKTDFIFESPAVNTEQAKTEEYGEVKIS